MSRTEESHFNLENKREKSNMSFGRNHKEKVSHRGGPWEGRVLMILHPLPQWSRFEGCVWVSTRKPGITSGILQTQVPGEGKKKGSALLWETSSFGGLHKQGEKRWLDLSIHENGGHGIHLLWLYSEAEVSSLGFRAEYGIVTKPRLHILEAKGLESESVQWCPLLVGKELASLA